MLKPGRDPRDKFVVPKFRDDVKEIADLKEGMELEGTVTNVTNFGAFVDLGVHQDGLVHISELSHKYVQDARQAVKVGDVVKVKVIGVDSRMKRISLSMKALLPKPPRRPRRKKQAQKPAVAVQQAAAAGAGVPEVVEGPPPPPKPRPLQPRPPRPDRKPDFRQATADRPPRPDRPKPPQPLAQPRPPKETVPAPPQTMEEKIRLLQEKFSSAS